MTGLEEWIRTAHALLASRPAESAKTVPMEMLKELYNIGFDDGLGVGKDDRRFDQIIQPYGYTVTESGK